MAHPTINKRNLLRADPTRTTLIRRAFQSDILRRVRALKRDVWDFLVALDALGLGDRDPLGALSTPRLGVRIALERSSDEQPAVLTNVQPREFQFRTDPDKIKAFREWLEAQIKERMLQGDDPNTPWPTKHIKNAYRKGQASASRSAGKKTAVIEGDAFFEQVHEQFLKSAFSMPNSIRKVQLLATRTFEELRGVTATMAQQMNRILAQGMLEGQGPKAIAKEMFSKINSITKARALTIARTETIAAHAEGQLDAFEQLGVKDLQVMAEWSTAGDDRVCSICQAMEGRKFDLELARGMIPAHPNCRCSWIPFTVPVRRKTKR